MNCSTHDHERKLVSAFFSKPPGFFVEVGANEPRARSQTWHLEQAGWSGILVEPQPQLTNALRAERRAIVVETACSSPDNAGRLLPLHVSGPLSSLDRDAMAPGARPEAVIEVPARTLDDILTEAGAPIGFDFLSIDVEGHEIEVLKGFSLDHWRPRLVLLEDHVPDLTRHRYMRTHGYTLIRRFDSNGWYVPRGTAATKSFGEVWEIVRKYYLALPIRMLRNAFRRVRASFAQLSAKLPLFR